MTTFNTALVERNFKSVLEKIAFEVPFEAEWKNDTGYFDHAVDCYVPEGRVVKSTCPTTKRRIILVGTVLGTVVVFERYTPDMDQAFILTWHAPKALRAFIGEPALTSDTLERIVCTYYPQENISKHVDALIDAGVKARKVLAEKAIAMATAPEKGVTCRVVPDDEVTSDTRPLVISETRPLTKFEAIVAATKQVNGLVLDDHRAPNGTLQLCGLATLDKGDSSITVALIKDDYFSLNEVYLGADGKVRVSTRAVGGVIHTPKRDGVTVEAGIATYNAEARSAKWSCGTVENVTMF